MTSSYACREVKECFNSRNNLQEGKEERMSLGFAGNREETTRNGTENTHWETVQEENGEQAAQPALKGAGIGEKVFGLS